MVDTDPNRPNVGQIWTGLSKFQVDSTRFRSGRNGEPRTAKVKPTTKTRPKTKTKTEADAKAKADAEAKSKAKATTKTKTNTELGSDGPSVE